MRNYLATAAAVGLLALPASAAHAEEAAGEWKQTVFLYGMGVAIDGDSQIGNLAFPIDASISDVFDALKFGAMAAYRVENDEWSFTGDVTYMNLGAKRSGPREIVRGEFGTDQLTVMATAGRRITPHVEALLSLVYFNLSSDLQLRVLEQQVGARRDADWVDPMVGAQYTVPFADKWSFTLRGDVGGFGVGSDFTWQILTGVRRQNTDRFGWYVGYRALGYDYETGKGQNYQHYDLVQQGPAAGVALSF